MTDRKLGRKKEHRERTMRNLATSLFLYEKMETTVAKAKALSPMVERLMTVAGKDTIDARRNVKASLFDMNAVRKLFEDIPSRRGGRTSGFVRITKIGPRNGDGAPMAQMELILTPLEQIVAEESSTKVKVRKSATPASDEVTKGE